MQKIHTWDTVMVIAGKDKWKIGKIRSFATPSRRKNGKIQDKMRKLVVVEGVNVVKKAVKGEGFSEIEKPIDISNVMYYDVEKKLASKIQIHMEEDKRVRVLKADGSVIK